MNDSPPSGRSFNVDKDHLRTLISKDLRPLTYNDNKYRRFVRLIIIIKYVAFAPTPDLRW